MKPTSAQRNGWFAQELLPGVAFKHNEYVQIISGEHVGIAGSLVSVETLGDDPVFLLELESGSDVHVRQSEIRRP